VSETAIVALALIVAIAVGAWLWSGRQAERAAASWARGEGRIVESRVEPQNEPGGARPNLRYAVRIAYEYDVAGKTYRNDRVRFRGSVLCATPAEAEAERARFPVGATVAVRYDPARPAAAVLEVAP
jgi:hypothetical protein